jgi:hypothetical protein
MMEAELSSKPLLLTMLKRLVAALIRGERFKPSLTLPNHILTLMNFINDDTRAEF